MLECRVHGWTDGHPTVIDHAPHTIMQAASVMIFRVSDSVCVGERVAPRDSTSVPVRPPMHSSRARADHTQTDAVPNSIAR